MISEGSDDQHMPQRRLCPPYIVKYLPWYLNINDRESLPEDVLYYLEHSIDSDLFKEYVGISSEAT